VCVCVCVCARIQVYVDSVQCTACIVPYLVPYLYAVEYSLFIVTSLTVASALELLYSYCMDYSRRADSGGIIVYVYSTLYAEIWNNFAHLDTFFLNLSRYWGMIFLSNSTRS
jgi:hypothetical protein